MPRTELGNILFSIAMVTFFRSRPHLLIYTLLIAAIFAVYGQTLRHEFINFDDDRYVSDNDIVKAGLTRQGFIWAFTTRTEANWHPLTWLSHMLDSQIYGTSSWGHHLSAVLIHTASALLLFLILLRLTGAVWRAGFVAIIFAAHPLHAESVAWIAERKDVLSAFFWMLTTLAYISYARKSGVGRYALVILLFALGLLAKPMLVSLPLALLLLDYWPLGRFRESISSNLKLLYEKLPLFVLAAFSCYITYEAQQKGGSMGSFEVYKTGVRFANAAVAYVSYLLKTLWPQNLAIYYIHPGRTLPLWQVVASYAILIAITTLVWRERRGRPYLIVGWLWYIVTLIPVIGLVQVGSQAMADRYTYIPLIGASLAGVWLISELFTRERIVAKQSGGSRRTPKRKQDTRIESVEVGTSPALVATAVLLSISMTVTAVFQVSTWRDSVTLFQHAVEVTGGSAPVRMLLGHAREARHRAYRSQGLEDKVHEEAQLAIEQYQAALDLKPNLVEARNNLALLQVEEGLLDEAISNYEEALKRKPNQAQVHNNYGRALVRTGRIDEGIEHFRKAISLKSNYAQPYCNLGSALADLGKFDEAVSEYKKALRVNPKFADAYCRMGLAQARQGKLDEALSNFKKTLQIDPTYSEAYNNTAATYFMLGDYTEAWRYIQLCRRHNCSPPPALLQALSNKMPEPRE